MARNWEEIGLSWETANVKSDNAVIAGAQLPVITDYVKLNEALIANGSSLLDLINASNSPRVAAQDVKRRNPDTSGETLREMVWDRLRGTRASSGTRTVTKVVIALPNGARYEGTNRTEFVAAYMAAGVDLGMTADVARKIAETIADTNAHLS
jgi:hypothetical protein